MVLGSIYSKTGTLLRLVFLAASTLCCAPLGYAVEPVGLKLSHTQLGARDFSGVDGLSIAQLTTELTTPLAQRSARVGVWTLGASLTENRFQLSGSTTANRRFYRLSLPIQYAPRRVGRFQHQWHLEPAHYSDESLISQTRETLEYAWRMNYWVNRKARWVLGVRKDSRFGVAKLYPIFGLVSQPKKGIEHHWVFPDLYSQFPINRKVSLRIYGQVIGGNWKYLQEEGTTASFGFSQWDVGLKAMMKTRKRFSMTASLGWSTSGEGSLAGSDGTLGDNAFFSFGIETNF